MRITIKPLTPKETFFMMSDLRDGIYIGNIASSDGPLAMVVVQKQLQKTVAAGFLIQECEDIRAWDSTSPNQTFSKLYNVTKVKPEEMNFREVMI